MGFFGHWYVVRGARPAALRRVGLDPAREETAPGWRYAFGREMTDDFEGVLEKVARAGDGTVVGAWVFDSDFGQAVALSNGRRAAVAIKPEFVDEPLEHDPEAFAAWSAETPNALTRAELQAILDRDDVFAEETVDELFDRLGLPAPYNPRDGKDSVSRKNIGAEVFGGYVEPLGSMRETAYVDPIDIPWRELRHVPGVGDAFLGIWDREAPAEPIATFAISQRGEAKLHEELERLQVPVRVQALGATGLGGFVEPAEILSTVRIAERDLSHRDARFLIGRGDGFVGIWDRERPAEPIERFPTSDEGVFEAMQRVHALLFDRELSAKETPGMRLFLPPRQQEMLRREMPRQPQGLSGDQRQMWEEMAANGWYVQTTGAPYLIVEEDADARWLAFMDFGDGGRFHLYSLGGHGEELACRGRFATVEQAQDYAEETDGATGDWQRVPATITRTLMATLRWAQHESVGGAGETWWERFDWATPSLHLEGSLSFARVFEGTAPVGVVLAAERGLENEAAVFLLRPRDEPRLVYSLDRLDMLLGLLPNYLGDVELGEWRALPDDSPRHLAALGPRVLRLAGVS